MKEFTKNNIHSNRIDIHVKDVKIHGLKTKMIEIQIVMIKPRIWAIEIKITANKRPLYSITTLPGIVYFFSFFFSVESL